MAAVTVPGRHRRQCQGQSILSTLILWIVMAVTLQSGICAASPQSQAQAMLQLRSSIDSLLVLNGTWNQASLPCDGSTPVWDGVYRCTPNGLVQSLVLSGWGLNGTLPNVPELYGELSSLQTLDLSNNRLQGALPAALTAMGPGLQVLILSANEFSGSIPELTALNGLIRLDLSSNIFSGPIPASLVSKTGVAMDFTGNPALCGAPATLAETANVAVDRLVSVPCDVENQINNEVQPAICSCALSWQSLSCFRGIEALCANNTGSICSGLKSSTSDAYWEYLVQQCGGILNAVNGGTAKPLDSTPLPANESVLSELTIQDIFVPDFDNTYKPQVIKSFADVSGVPGGKIAFLSVTGMNGENAGRRRLLAGRRLMQNVSTTGLGLTGQVYILTDNAQAVGKKLSDANADGSFTQLMRENGVDFNSGLDVLSPEEVTEPKGGKKGGNQKEWHGLPLWAWYLIAGVGGGILLFAALCTICIVSVRRRTKVNTTNRFKPALPGATAPPPDAIKAEAAPPPIRRSPSKPPPPAAKVPSRAAVDIPVTTNIRPRRADEVDITSELQRETIASRRGAAPYGANP